MTGVDEVLGPVPSVCPFLNMFNKEYLFPSLLPAPPLPNGVMSVSLSASVPADRGLRGLARVAKEVLRLTAGGTGYVIWGKEGRREPGSIGLGLGLFE